MILMAVVILIHQPVLMFAVNFLLNATRSAIPLGLDLPLRAVQTGWASCLTLVLTVGWILSFQTQ